MNIFLSPPLAFIIYLLAVGGLALVGKGMAAPARPAPHKTNLYASGNPPPEQAAPSYRGFFLIALFFAVLHLSALIIGSSDLSPTAAVYVVGLALTLAAVLLG